MTVVYHGSRHVPGLPAQQPGSNPQVRVVAVGEERLVEAACLLEQLPVIQSRAGVRPEDFLRPVILACVRFHGAAAAILAIPVDEVACLVDYARRVVKQDLAGQHPDPALHVTVPQQLFQPCGIGDRIVVEKSDPFSARTSERQVVGAAETGVAWQQDSLRVGQPFRPGTDDLPAAVTRPVVHEYEFPLQPGLPCKRGETVVEKLQAVPVDHYNADQRTVRPAFCHRQLRLLFFSS